MKFTKLFLTTLFLTAAFLLNASFIIAAEQQVLRFATWDSEEALEQQKQIARLFEKKHPNVKVQVEAYADGYDQKLAASFGASNPPDVMYMWDFPHYYQSLESLNQYIKKDKGLDLSDIPSGLLNYSTMDGKTYGLPAGFTSHVIYYNKDLFDKAGIAYPKDDWTWSDFRKMAKTFRNKSKKQYGFGFWAKPDPYDFEQFLWSNETSYISADGKMIDGYMNSKASAEVVDMFVDMAKQEEAVLLGVGDNTSGSGLFKSDRIAMYESGIWPKVGFEKAKKNFGIAPLPAFPGKTSKSVINQSAISMAKDSKQKDLAWEFIKFYVSPEAIKTRTYDLPVRRSVVKELKYDQNPMMKPFYTMLENSDNTPAFLLHKKWPKIQRGLSLALETSFIKRNDSQQNLDTAVKRARRYLRN